MTWFRALDCRDWKTQLNKVSPKTTCGLLFGWRVTAGIECMLGSAMYLKSTGMSLKIGIIICSFFFFSHRKDYKMLLVLYANLFSLPFPNPDAFIIRCGNKSSVLIHECYCIHCSKMPENGQF